MYIVRKKALRSQKKAWALVIKWHHWIVKYTAKEFSKMISSFSKTVFTREYDDCIQSALLISFRAAELFDEKKGFAFPTYAMHWIDRYAFKAHLEKRFVKGKLVRFTEEQKEQHDIGASEYELIDEINRKEISKAFSSKVSSNDLLTDLFKNDKNCAAIAKENDRSREAIRLRRNKLLSKIKVSQRAYVL
jgi:RNA polymerase sigma factor (sigma-70 family)